MYQISYNTRKYATLFDTYEKARQHVRKLLRKKVESRSKGQPDIPLQISGYSIIKVL